MRSKILVVILIILFSYHPSNPRIYNPYIDDNCISESELKHFEEPGVKPLYTNIRGSIYHCVAGQTDSTPFITASGYVIDTLKLNRKQLRVVALSQDLIKCYGLGGKLKYPQKIFIEGPSKISGWWTVRDCMPDHRRNSIDFLQPEIGGFFGVWSNIKIYTENPQDKKKKKAS